MRKIFFIILLVLIPGIACGSVAGDFTVSRQSTYSVPRDVAKILVLDLTLPDPPESGTLQVKSIKIHNAGTADHLDFSKLMIWEDGPSAGWNNDETEAAKVYISPFDTAIPGTFRKYSKGDSWQRIFVTLDTTSETLSLSERTIKPELVVDSIIFTDPAFNGPTDASIIGFERTISKDASAPAVPVTPLAGTPKALSTSSIRWYFTDLSNNEFGFKLLDNNLKEVARVEQADLSYLDETGLNPDTEYSGRQVVAFNDRGESSGSTLTVFPATRTLALPVVEIIEEPASTTTSVATSAPLSGTTVAKEPTLFETIQAKIADIQRQINELLQKINELLQQQAATIWQALAGFLQSSFGK